METNIDVKIENYFKLLKTTGSPENLFNIYIDIINDLRTYNLNRKQSIEYVALKNAYEKQIKVSINNLY